MSVAKSLPPVDPFFMQTCPLCGTPQRMMVKGSYIEKNKATLHPDMGYSFCNCRNIFFTKWENVSRPSEGLNSHPYPLMRLREIHDELERGVCIKLTMRDPYFINWTKPQEFTGFVPRTNYILWDAESFIDECKYAGFEIVDWYRDMDVESTTPECYHITMRKL